MAYSKYLVELTLRFTVEVDNDDVAADEYEAVYAAADDALPHIHGAELDNFEYQRVA